MKKNYVFVCLLAAAAGSLAFMSSADYSNDLITYKNSHMNQAGSPSGRTGAPGESNCTACHSGSVQSGSGVNTVIFTEGANVVTSYTPGTTYNVAVNMTSASNKNGFEIVALTGSNAQAGSVAIIPSTGVQLVNGSGGKKYVTHTTSGTAQTTWGFQWTAPATNVGNVTFYLATNETDAGNSASGDVIRVSQHVIGSVAGIEENAGNMNLSVAYQTNNNTLSVRYNSLTAGETGVNLVDLSGKSVFNETIGSTEVGENDKAVKLPSDLKAGIYIVHLNVNNTFTSKKIYIQ